MDPLVLFLLHVALYAALPIFFATRRSSMRLVFLYVYISMVHVVGGFLGAVVSFPLTEGVVVSSGSLAYGAFMMSTVILVIVGRDLQVVRNVIKLVIATNVFKFGIFSLTSAGLDASGSLNPFGTAPDVFNVSLRVVVVGGALIIFELLLLVAIFERVKDRVHDPRALAGLYVLFFIATLCLDGVLFPTIAFPFDPALGTLVATGLQAKFVMACAFAVPLVAFLFFSRSSVVAYEMTPMKLTELFVAQREELVQEIGRQQMELAEGEERYRQLAESIRDSLFTLDADMRFTYLNAAASGWGRSRQDVLGKRFPEVFPESTLIPFYSEAIQSQEPRHTTVEAEVEGAPAVFDISAFPYKGGVSVLARDITSSARLQAQILQSQKMEAIGQLAGGIAHDFNNLLSVINNYAAFVHAELPPDSPAREDAEEVMKAGERAAALVRQLLAFSRAESLRPVVLEVDEVISGMEGLLRRTIPESIELEIELGSGGPVEIDQTKFEQAILNLAVNARDAMPSGGKLSIHTATVEVDAERATSLKLSPRPHVAIYVTDTGHGMTDEIAERAFEPFFTTKARESGTGLGLAGVYATCKAAGGLVNLSTKPGEGSTFEILLPLAGDRLAPP